MKTDLELIAEILSLSEDEAFAVLELCQWADHEVAIELHGYPKDNLFPPPIAERLADARYVRRLTRLAAEDDALDPRIDDALGERLGALADRNDED